MKYRFGVERRWWSPFGKSTIYYAGNVIFQSSNLGQSWESISMI